MGIMDLGEALMGEGKYAEEKKRRKQMEQLEKLRLTRRNGRFSTSGANRGGSDYDSMEDMEDYAPSAPVTYSRRIRYVPVGMSPEMMAEKPKGLLRGTASAVYHGPANVYRAITGTYKGAKEDIEKVKEVNAIRKEVFGGARELYTDIKAQRRAEKYFKKRPGQREKVEEIERGMKADETFAGIKKI